ncbi:dienelactone hydrolase family protein [Catenuloplanes japonicus]|uniref:dienelactone hydrolase family protein n=1 Tax=Catenuloplanes japonicus TaxID=33876 RepID=UPI0005261798|nr:dienelactone hydrolase family protein [Catenuloplanes japonicus]
MGSMVSYRSNGGTSEGYLAKPASGSGPGVIVIQEWWGLVEHITALADRFAEAGFVALAPDLYHGRQTTYPNEAVKLLMGLAIDQAARDIAGAADYVAELPETSGNIGAVGFCMGGSLALWSATLSDRIVATSGFYPAVPWERMAPKWDNYAGKAAIVHCAEEDGLSVAEGPQVAKAGIELAGGDVTLYDYPGTAHAFFNDDHPDTYDQSASATAWARTLELFRTRL